VGIPGAGPALVLSTFGRSDAKMPIREPASRLALRAVIRCAVFIGVPFACAGRLDWPRGWFFMALTAVTLAVTVPLFQRENPGILRMRLQKTEGTKPFDKVIYVILMLSFFGCLAVAGLDARFGWSSLPFEWTFLGLLLYIAGSIPIGLAAATNPFLERTIRIQDERGHVTVTSGPYRVVRHPMYAGLILGMAGWPLLLGSKWSYVPFAVVAVTLIVRTALEDRTLRRELPGYEEYAARTRYRLIPGIW
jgi:protein-S-isoprenylcysteine O-methyltransferase Ste14